MVKAVQGKEVGRDVTEGEVRADPVIVVRAPVFDEESGFGQGAKPMLVEAVVAVPSRPCCRELRQPLTITKRLSTCPYMSDSIALGRSRSSGIKSK